MNEFKKSSDYKYVQNLDVFGCPSDKGRHALRSKKQLQRYGNSYNARFQHDSFRVRHVLGDLMQQKGSYGWDSIKMAEVAKSAANKIILGDNRGMRIEDNPKDLWHNYKGHRRENMLFGDGHAEFTSSRPKYRNGFGKPKPAPSFHWW